MAQRDNDEYGRRDCGGKRTRSRKESVKNADASH